MMESLAWHTEQRKVNELIPLERNPFGKIRRAAKKRLESKVKRLGVFEIPTIDRNNELLTFNKRRHILIALDRGDETIDVRVPNRELTKEERQEVILSSNIHEGQWDSVILAEDFSNIDLGEIGIDVESLDLDWFDEKEATDDDFIIPEIVQTDIVEGDLIEIGPHRLLCGDSGNQDQVQRLMGGEMFDLVMTDPPYNVDYEGGTGMKILNDKMSDSGFFQFLLEFHQAFYKFTKPGGVWYVWHADTAGYNFRKAFVESGLLLKQCLIWVKNQLVLGFQDYQWKHEPCLYGWKPGAGHYFIDDRSKTTVIDSNKIDYNKMKREELLEVINKLTSETENTTVLYHNKPSRNDLHPTMKPVPLIGGLIKNSSHPGDIVGDGFLGSGTTMVASDQLRRKCYAMELDPKFCQVTIDRMRHLNPSLEILINGIHYQPKVAVSIN